MGKRILSFVITILLLTSFFAASAFADGNDALVIDSDIIYVEVNGTDNGTIEYKQSLDSSSIITDGKEVTVDGNVTSNNTAVEAENGSKITIEGNVTGEDAISLNGENNTVVVEGEVSGTAYSVVLDSSCDNSNVIIVNELSGNLGVKSQEGIKEATSDTEISLFKQIINYIVGKDKMDDASLSGTETISVNDKKYIVAREGDELTVSGENIANVTAGQNAEVTANGDGTFTIKVLRGGALDIAVTKSHSQYTFFGPDIVVAPTIKIKFDDVYDVHLSQPLEVTADISKGSDIVSLNINSLVLNVDEIKLSSDDYTASVKDGKLIIEFPYEFLSKLSRGTHTVKLTVAANTFYFNIRTDSYDANRKQF